MTNRRRKSGPPGADVGVRFESFYARASTSTARLEAILARERGLLARGTRVHVLGRDPARVILVPHRSRTPGQAWADARALTAALRDARIEGGIVEPLFGLTAPATASTKKGGGAGQPLPCAAHDCDWSLDNTKTYPAWALVPPAGGASMGAGIRIGHPDTGYTLHDQIWAADPAQRRVRPELGHDFFDDRPDPRDPLSGPNAGHGTGTASVIMSDAGGGDPFVTGVAPRAELVPLRVSDSVVHFSFTCLTLALRHAVDVAGTDLVSMSLGGPIPSRALEDAVLHAFERGVILLAAAGNVWPWVVFPARYSKVIAVAASNCRDDTWKSSASGDAVDVTAPGESVWRARARKPSTFDVEPSSGTSYAVATTAGACALWLAFHGGRQKLIQLAGGPHRLAPLFRRVLLRTVRRPAGWDTGGFGAGILDVKALLEAPLASSKAGAPRAKRALSADPMERLAEFFPAELRARAEARVQRKLGRMPAERRRNLARFGDELVFQVGTDPGLRHDLARPAAKGKSVRCHSERGSQELRNLLES